MRSPRLAAPVVRFVVGSKRRWVASGLPDYPLWIAALIDSAALLTAVVAVAQRGDRGLPLPVLLMLAALLPWVLELWARASTWPFFTVLTGGGVLVLMTAYPVDVDFAPLLLVLMAGHVTAVAGLVRGLGMTVVGEVVVAAVSLAGHMPGAELAIWMVAIVAGLDIGFVMRSQQLRLEAQAREHAVRERQAVLEERQRIARDVHDLVAHSLSVTMLHLTAARREVEDAAGPADRTLDDAVDALRDAERVGRRAMADIRGAVGLLGRSDEAVDAVAAPTLADLPGLVAEFERAGIRARYDARGDVEDVPAGTALGLYRIVQESLSNVAKHAPGSPVAVRLDLAQGPGVLTVTSDLPRATRRGPGGSGLSGMAERAAQLGAAFAAGPQGRTWVVRVDLPAGAAGRA